ncbi:DUF4124 domain-containing protein [Ideonella sp.]|uniref:DUF4124 domain-containing protein n=1 Tax=Ideonella sp. TaxID=1929293 RepID=UPI0035B295C2
MNTKHLSAARLGALTVLLALACGSASAQSIWKWRDRDGRVQVSDRPPPVDVPDKDILQRPGGARPSAPAPAASDNAASAPAGVDPALEARRQKAQAEQAAADKARQAADKTRRDQQRAENCDRARRQLAALESGQRVGRMNDSGEREILDDTGRAQEIARYRQIADTACQPAP